MTDDRHKDVRGLLEYLVRWERFLDRGVGAADGLFGREASGVKIGISPAGFLSTRFTCRFTLGRVEVDCESISTIDTNGETDEPRRSNALATVRLAILLLRGELDGVEWLLNDPQATVHVHASPRATSFEVRDGQGAVCMFENGWDGLVRLIEQRTGRDGFTVVWA